MLMIPGDEHSPPAAWMFPYYERTELNFAQADHEIAPVSRVYELVYRRMSYGGCDASYVPDDRIPGNVQRCADAAEAMEPGEYARVELAPSRGAMTYVQVGNTVTVTGSCGTVEPTVEGSEYARVGNQIHEEVRGVGRQTGPRSWDASAGTEDPPDDWLQWEALEEREPWELTGYVPDWAKPE